MPDDRWLTAPEFGRTYGYTDGAVRRMAKAGALRTSLRDGVLMVALAASAALPDCSADAVPRLSRGVVAELLGVKPKRVAELVAEGRLRRHQVGRGWRYSVNDVFDYLAGRQGRGEPYRDQMMRWASRRLSVKVAAGYGSAGSGDAFDEAMRRIGTLPAVRQPVEYARLLLRYERGRKRHLSAVERREPARAHTPPEEPGSTGPVS